MRSLSLFTGYGGIDLALEEYARPIGYCEINKYAQGIISSRIATGELPLAPIYPDVTRLRGRPGICDIIVGGFPCQDISVAGNGAGLAGERSGLFYEIARLTKEIRPNFVFLENVPSIRTRGLEQVIKEFAKIGYDCRWTCLSAASIGANHKRERWFMLAHTKRNQSGIQPRGSSWSCRTKKADYMDRAWWDAEPSLDRVDNGTPFRLDRITALGNGVVPLQVKTAFKKLMGLK